MAFEGLPDAWVVWSDEEGGRAVLAYRPDVFDADEYPAACLPTIYVTRGPSERRRPPTDRRALADADWRVTLFIEPEVEASEQSFETREAATEAAVSLARAFDDGEIDYRSHYQVPREAYLDRLDQLTGRDG